MEVLRSRNKVRHGGAEDLINLKFQGTESYMERQGQGKSPTWSVEVKELSPTWSAEVKEQFRHGENVGKSVDHVCISTGHLSKSADHHCSSVHHHSISAITAGHLDCSRCSLSHRRRYGWWKCNFLANNGGDDKNRGNDRNFAIEVEDVLRSNQTAAYVVV
ncbi:hypothetical protein SESBI_00340 [Sesbania bispinosa]|nr:hypothetical protein SESBI_00340 [Sesbania bispinosa]